MNTQDKLDDTIKRLIANNVKPDGKIDTDSVRSALANYGQSNLVLDSSVWHDWARGKMNSYKDKNSLRVDRNFESRCDGPEYWCFGYSFKPGTVIPLNEKGDWTTVEEMRFIHIPLRIDLLTRKKQQVIKSINKELEMWRFIGDKWPSDYLTLKMLCLNYNRILEKEAGYPI